MSGSMDDRRVELLNVREDTLLLLMIRKDNTVQLDTSLNPQACAEVLRMFAEQIEAAHQ